MFLNSHSHLLHIIDSYDIQLQLSLDAAQQQQQRQQRAIGVAGLKSSTSMMTSSMDGGRSDLPPIQTTTDPSARDRIGLSSQTYSTSGSGSGGRWMG